MFEKVRESLGPVGRLQGHTRGHGSCDEKELPLDGGRHPARAPSDDRIEPPDRPLEALHHRELRAPPIPIFRQQDDLSHGPMMGDASDTTWERRGFLGDSDRIHRRQPLPHGEPGSPCISRSEHVT